MSSKGKLTYLEGMRALMAFNVILCHFVCVYYPMMYFQGYDSALSCFESTPLSALVNGNIAVVFFFALTGFLVGRSVFLKNVDMHTVPQKAFNRFLRLLPVVVLTTLFTFLTMKLGLQYHLDITNENVNADFLAAYCNFDPSLGHLITHALFWPFVDYSAYVGPFWTISYELWGYVIVLLLALFLKESKWRRLVYCVISVVIYICIDPQYCIFIMGLLVADLEFNTNATVCDKLYRKLLMSKVFVVFCFFVATYFACCPMNDRSPFYSFWFKLPLLTHTLLRGFGMALFIWVAVNSKLIQKILSFKPLVFLGEMSFETYALHWPLMLSCEAALFLALVECLDYNKAALLSFGITVVIIYISSFFFSILVKKINKIIDRFKNK